MSFFGMFKGKGANGFGYNSTAEEVTEGLDLSGKTYLVTGCNSGLGFETTRVLILRGARVFGAARTLAKAEFSGALYGDAFVPLECNLAAPSSIRSALATLAQHNAHFDGIVANAGIMSLPYRVTACGAELQMLTNHLGHFLLVTELLDRLHPEGRVVVLSSVAHKDTYREGLRLRDLDAAHKYHRWQAYGQSKLANILFVRELARRLPKGQSAYAIHPGVIATGITRYLPRVLSWAFEKVGPTLAAKSIPQGTATQVYAVAHPDAAEINGAYWADVNPAQSSRFGQDLELAAALWVRSEAWVRDHGGGSKA
ncbi:MAG TPA: short-chain dehydrogenase/reductase SDR [Myxococcales bacterium]|nr:short-chain dehydrogenase/reductase SDR [Myxococcales bacterium]